MSSVEGEPEKSVEASSDGGARPGPDAVSTVELPVLTESDPESDPAWPTEAELNRLERGTLIDRFVILRQVGEGGMGVVFLAYDEVLDRKVAIKLVPPLRRRPSASLRLLREAQGLGRLSHPNVVAVHSAGWHRNAVFIAMEYVSGVTLREWLTTPHEWRMTLAMLIGAGRGLAAAHENHLVHRDFKPDNVMISTDGRARVLDFGLVRGFETDELPEPEPPGDASHDSLVERWRHEEIRGLTQGGALLGTIPYMAPEQLERRRADSLSDQFSFCSTLYEALYDQRPFSGASVDAQLESIRTSDLSVRPKTAVPREIHEAISRGLAPKPEDRWPDMESLLDALDSRLQRRSRGWAWVSAGSLVLVLAGLSAAIPRIRQALDQRDERIAAESAALLEGYVSLEQQRAVAKGLRAQVLATDTSTAVEAVTLALELYTQHEARPEGMLPEVEAAIYAATKHLHHGWTLRGSEPSISLAFSPQAAVVAAGRADGMVQLWDATSGMHVGDCEGHIAAIESLAFSPDGLFLLSTAADATAVVWDVVHRRSLATIDAHAVRSAGFSHDGTRLATGGDDGQLMLWSLEPGQALGQVPMVADGRGSEIIDLAFSADDSRLIAVRSEAITISSIGLGDEPMVFANTGARLRTAQDSVRAGIPTRTLALSADTSLLAVPGPNATIVLYETATGAVRTRIATGQDELLALGFAPGPELRLASTGRGGPPQIWDADTGALDVVLDAHHTISRDFAFSPDGQALATIGYDDRVRVSNTKNGRLIETMSVESGLLAGVAFAPESNRIAVVGTELIRVFDGARMTERQIIDGDEPTATAIFGPDASELFVGGLNNAQLIPLAAAGPNRAFDHKGASVLAASYARDGRLLATSDSERHIRVWAAETGVVRHRFDDHAVGVEALSFSPDGQVLASADLHGHLRLRATDSGALLRSWRADERGVVALAFSDRGDQIVTGSPRGVIEVWNVDDGQRVARLDTGAIVFALSFVGPERVVIGGDQRELTLWNYAEASQVSLVGPAVGVEVLTPLPGTSRVLVGSTGQAHLFDIDARQAIAAFGFFVDPSAEILDIALSHDGRHVFAANASGQVSVSTMDPRLRLVAACDLLLGTYGRTELSTTCALLDPSVRP